MDKATFVKRVVLWTTIITAVIIAVIGICFGSVIEANIGEEIGKWVLMGGVVIVIVDVLAYILGPIIYDIKKSKGKV